MKLVGPLEFKSIYQLPRDLPIGVSDHLGGFDQHGICTPLYKINDYSLPGRTVLTEYLLPPDMADQYHNLHLVFNTEYWHSRNLIDPIYTYTQHPLRENKKFLCSFNGNDHVSRRLLVLALNKFGWFDHDTCSKNFHLNQDVVDGNISDYVPHNLRFYRKFFIPGDSEFYKKINSFGHHRLSHAYNIQHLEKVLTTSFVNLVSETVATGYQPFITEKFLYSVVTRGLFVAYAQPKWHQYLSCYFGFKQFDKVFDYSFDITPNPVERLVQLLSMLSKFSRLSPSDWHDLYLMEQDAIEYNYDHFFSKRYLEQLKCSENIDRSAVFV